MRRLVLMAVLLASATWCCHGNAQPNRRAAKAAYRIAYIDPSANIATVGLDAQGQPIIGSEAKLTRHGGVTNFILSRDGRQVALVQRNSLIMMDLRSGKFRSVKLKGYDEMLSKGELSLDIEEFSPSGRYISGRIVNGVGGWPWNVFDVKTGEVVSEHSGGSWGGPSKPYVWASNRDWIAANRGYGFLDSEDIHNLMSSGLGLSGFEPVVVLQFDKRDRKGRPTEVVVADPRREKDWSNTSPVAVEAVAWTKEGVIIAKYACRPNAQGKWTVNTSYWVAQPGAVRRQISALPADTTKKLCKERSRQTGLNPEQLTLGDKSPDGKFCLAQRLSSPNSGSMPLATYVVALEGSPRFIDLSNTVKYHLKDVTTGLLTVGSSRKVIWLASSSNPQSVS